MCSLFYCQFYFLLYRNTAKSPTMPEIISKPGVVLLSFAGVLVSVFFSGVCSTFAAVASVFCSGPGVLFSGCITVPVAFVLSLTALLLTIATPLRLPLLWLLPPLLVVTCSTVI